MVMNVDHFVMNFRQIGIHQNQKWKSRYLHVYLGLECHDGFKSGLLDKKRLSGFYER